MAAADPVGVFDSGLGGLSVLKALRAELPHEHFVYFADSAHAPYGEKPESFVADRSLAIATDLLAAHNAKAIVVACNTATAAAVQRLRESFPQLPVVGIEPGLKPAAAMTRTRRVGVMATRGTLASARFQALHERLASQAEFLLQPCDGLAGAIERGDEALVARLCESHVRAMGAFGDAPGQVDTLVLGCTHYPFAMEQISRLVGPRITLVETGGPVARRARALLGSRGLLRDEGDGGVQLRSSGDVEALRAVASRWLG